MLSPMEIQLPSRFWERICKNDTKAIRGLKDDPSERFIGKSSDEAK